LLDKGHLQFLRNMRVEMGWRSIEEGKSV
jgi:hypothetical protein